MSNKNINNDKPNGNNFPYGPNPTPAGSYTQPKPDKASSNQLLAQSNPSFPQLNSGAPAPSFSNSTIPPQNNNGYPQGNEAIPSAEDHPNPGSSIVNAALANSSLLQMLGGTFPKASGPEAKVEETPVQSLPSDQESAMLKQFNLAAECLVNKGDFATAANYYEKIVEMDSENGAAWSSLGHCYLLINNLQRAFTSYQKALYTLPDVHDPQLWYGIGVLYEKVFLFLLNSMRRMNMQYQHLYQY